MDQVNRPKRWFRRHPVLAFSAVSVLGCIAILTVLEIGVRVFFPGWLLNRGVSKFWQFDPLLGWAQRPHQRGRFENYSFSVEVATNSHGMRDSEYSLNRTEKHRMLVLGDSFAWGYGVEQSQRFSEILEESHPDWEIINTGVNGYGTDQEYLDLRERGIAFRPDVVLLLFCFNDPENNAHAVEYGYRKPFFRVEGGKLQPRNNPVSYTLIEQLRNCNKNRGISREKCGNSASRPIFVTVSKEGCRTRDLRRRTASCLVELGTRPPSRFLGQRGWRHSARPRRRRAHDCHERVAQSHQESLQPLIFVVRTRHYAFGATAKGILTRNR